MDTMRKKLNAGKKVAGCMIRISRNPAIMYLVSAAGLDFVILDCEHAEFGTETVHGIAMMGKALGISTIVRVPELSEAWISRTLDIGAEGIMVPNLETAEQAQLLVKYAKYPPIGDRGFTANGPHTSYRGGKHADVLREVNAGTIVIAQIETKLAVENAEQIAAVEGIDALLIGPNDLSISLGIPGEVMSETECAAISKVADACEAHGKFFSLHSGAKLSDKFINRLSFVTQGSDLSMLTDALKKVRTYADDNLPR